jgi:hypothetical protein
MSNVADSFENTLLDTLSSNASTLHLYTSDPGDDNSGTECSDSTYSNQTITFGTASSGSMSNSGAITFPAFTGAVTVSHWGIQDSLSNLLVYGAISGGSVAASAGDSVKFADASITVTCD